MGMGFVEIMEDYDILWEDHRLKWMRARDLFIIIWDVSVYYAPKQAGGFKSLLFPIVFGMVILVDKQFWDGVPCYACLPCLCTSAYVNMPYIPREMERSKVTVASLDHVHVAEDDEWPCFRRSDFEGCESRVSDDRMISNDWISDELVKINQIGCGSFSLEAFMKDLSK